MLGPTISECVKCLKTWIGDTACHKHLKRNHYEEGTHQNWTNKREIKILTCRCQWGPNNVSFLLIMGKYNRLLERHWYIPWHQKSLPVVLFVCFFISVHGFSSVTPAELEKHACWVDRTPHGHKPLHALPPFWVLPKPKMLPMTYHLVLFKRVNSSCILNRYRPTVYLLGFITPLNKSSLFTACPLFDDQTHTVTYVTFKFELFCNFFIDSFRHWRLRI